MAKYYFNKYQAIPRYNEPGWGTPSERRLQLNATVVYSNYSWDSINAKFLPAGPRLSDSVITVGQVVYDVSMGSAVYKFTAKEGGTWFYDLLYTQEVKEAINLTPSTYTQGSLVQSNIIAENGVYPVNGRHSDGYWYIRGSLVNTAPTTPGAFTQPSGTLEIGDAKVFSVGASSDAEGNLSKYIWEAAINGGSFSKVGETSSPSFTYTIPTATSLKMRVKAVDSGGLESGYRESAVFTVVKPNAIPTITLNTKNNVTLYENDIFRVEGQAQDGDAGQIVNVRYQINAGTARAIATAISDGTTPIAFSRQLTFKGGILYEGETAITSALAEGVAHTLRVWAEDDQGGKSTVAERTFYVVPNRPPTLSIDAFDPRDGLIGADEITFTGTASDPDGNDITVNYRLNNGLNTQIYSGPSSDWSFKLRTSALTDGANTIVVEVTDVYGSKYSRTVKLNKHANLTPLTTTTQRYKITPPAGSAKGVLMWVQRDDSLALTADISMTNGTEPESYAPMSLENTAPVAGNVVEDEFIYQAAEPAEHINVKLTLTGDGTITIISGVLSQ